MISAHRWRPLKAPTAILKTGDFKPEYAGKWNFDLSAVDGIMKTDRDDPTIGLLLCETKNEAIVELPQEC
jgi:hypothetical protein